MILTAVSQSVIEWVIDSTTYNYSFKLEIANSYPIYRACELVTSRIFITLCIDVQFEFEAFSGNAKEPAG